MVSKDQARCGLTVLIGFILTIEGLIAYYLQDLSQLLFTVESSATARTLLAFIGAAVVCSGAILKAENLVKSKPS